MSSQHKTLKKSIHFSLYNHNSFNLIFAFFSKFNIETNILAEDDEYEQ